eukprot:14574595-Alexandrium_andersonii.AAC.1
MGPSPPRTPTPPISGSSAPEALIRRGSGRAVAPPRGPRGGPGGRTPAGAGNCRKLLPAVSCDACP